MTNNDEIDAWIATGQKVMKAAAEVQRQIDERFGVTKPATWVWEVGDHVRKLKGYEFDSEVRAVFTNKAGEVRLVCESLFIPGMLHIFNGDQMEIVE